MKKYSDWFIQFWIIVSIVCFSIETLPDLDANWIWWLNLIEYISVAVFSVEYICRIYHSGFRYIISFFGIIDLLSILPFYIGAAIDLRSVRALRLFRLFRLLKLTRHSKALDRIKFAFSSIKEELMVFGGLTLIVIYLSAVGIYHFENAVQPEAFSSVFDALWWSVATLTTVGYGDVYPKTVGGKLFTCCILFVGLGIVSIPAGLIASALTKERNE